MEKKLELIFVSITLILILSCKKETVTTSENNINGCVNELNGFEYIGKTDFKPDLEISDIIRFSLRYANRLNQGFDIVYCALVKTMNGPSSWRAYRVQFDLNKNKIKSYQTEVADLYYSSTLNLSDLHLISDFENSLIYYVSDYFSPQPTITIERVMPDSKGSLNPKNAYVYTGQYARILYVNSQYFIYNDWDGDILNGVVMEDTTLLYIGQTKQWSNNDMYVGRSTKNVKKTMHAGVEQFWWDTDQFNITEIATQSNGDNMTKIDFVKGTKVDGNYIISVYFSNKVGKKYSIDPTNYQFNELGSYSTDLIKSENVEMLSNGSLLTGLVSVSGLVYYNFSAKANFKILDINHSSDVVMPEFKTDDADFKYYAYTNNDYLYLLATYKGEAYFYRKKLI